MGLILLGVATPNESAATGVVGALIAAAIFKRLTFKMCYESILGTCSVSTMILIIIACSMLFGQLLSFTGATTGLVTVATEMKLPGMATFFVLMLIPFILCMFIDLFAVMLVAIPIYDPLLTVYNFDPIWFWTLFLIVATLGGLTPPFGYVLFALKSAAPDLPTTEIYRASWPFVFLIVFGMIILVIFPDLITFLPNLTRPK
jgi:TRAP-type C4-dicarboxylate transport system permease large subunit